MKIIIPYDLDEEDFIPKERATLCEAQIFSKLNHPNIIKLLNAYVHKNNHYLVFKLMETSLDANIPFFLARRKFTCKCWCKGLHVYTKTPSITRTSFNLLHTVHVAPSGLTPKGPRRLVKNLDVLKSCIP